MGEIRLKRAYDSAGPDDGMRILVDRLWPRGLSRERAKVDHWLKEVAPSAKLRRWFGHDPMKWVEFRRRYETELRGNPAMEELRALIRHNRRVTLLFGARDVEHNNAAVLRTVCARDPDTGPAQAAAR
jgi:uncharacterized protein YeaO (DUF488 family)